MSYSLNKPCCECVQDGECIDPRILEFFIRLIHQAGTDRRHLGAGTIDLKCCNFVANEFRSGK